MPCSQLFICFVLQRVQGFLTALKTPGVPSRDQDHNILSGQKERSVDSQVLNQAGMPILNQGYCAHAQRARFYTIYKPYLA